MEPHYGKPDNEYQYAVDWNRSVDDFYKTAFMYAQDHHPVQLEHFRQVKLSELTPHYFWSEYIWAVYVSGFNAKVITKKFNSLITAYGPWTWVQPRSAVWARVEPVFKNNKKFGAIYSCRLMMQATGWDKFKLEYCQYPSTLQKLPFIGKITCYHLARNIGIDAVKSDIHLVRVAKHFKYDTPLDLCHHLAQKYKERIGVIDFVIWSWCAGLGSKELA